MFPDNKVQMPVEFEAKVTGSPELADALSARGQCRVTSGAFSPNPMVWVAKTVKLWPTGDAAAYVMLPLWLAVIEHVPAARNVTVTPETAHTVSSCWN